MAGLVSGAYGAVMSDGARMSDFEAVLERLLTDLSFAAQLAADPARALAGYTLDEGESELLRSQVSTDADGAASAVETRTSESVSFSSLGEWAEFGSAAGVGAGQASQRLASSYEVPGDDIRRLAAELGEPRATSGMGDAPDPGAGAGAPMARKGMGDAPDLDGLPAVTGLGDAPRTGLGDAAAVGVAEPAEIPAPKGYRNKVDSDGDGRWDEATYRGRADGGVDILVDRNGDGRPEFIGHDRDRDWVVDSAAFDRDGDGVLEKRMYDDNGDGWLDRTVWQND